MTDTPETTYPPEWQPALAHSRYLRHLLAARPEVVGACLLLTAVLVGWRLRPEILRVELSRELDLFFALWQRLLRYVAPPAIAVILIVAVLRVVTSLSTTGVLQ